MKKYLLIILMMYPVFVLFAQAEYGTPEERSQKMTEEMVKAMRLSEQQAITIHALNLRYARRIQIEVIDTDLNIWQQYRRIKKINQIKEEELQLLVTKEQWIAYEKLKAEKLKEMLGQFFGQNTEPPF